MSVRPDVHIDRTRSPRLIVVEAPSVSITIQDLVDTCRVLESELSALDDVTPLLNATGKQNLGDGVFVGITVQLTDAQISFEARTTPNSTGTATSSDAAGILLTDTGATFISDGLRPGDSIINFTKLAVTTITSVVSETQVRGYALAGGTNTWSTGDVYKVYSVADCVISGGNITALDAADASINPVFRTFGTQVVIAQATSAALIDGGAAANPWSIATAGNETSGTFGERVKNIKNDTGLIPSLV